jgi:vacuolar-type H+-ATPase subunit I/STV1
MTRENQVKDESNLPVSEQSLVFRLRKRAEIRRNIKDRKSVQEGAADRIADLLEEAADELEALRQLRHELQGVLEDSKQGEFDTICQRTLQHVIDRLAGAK